MKQMQPAVARIGPCRQEENTDVWWDVPVFDGCNRCVPLLDHTEFCLLLAARPTP